ncbi:MAG: PAS domain-containing sensor histidine kinase [Desulfuromonas sp.]|nr:MAG: PAS domain-containing sensor histidine kinase [Desulfuromonas sp.]
MTIAQLPEAYFIRLLENLEDGLLAFDLDGRVRFLNPSAQEMLGLSKRQAIGHAAKDIFPGQSNLLHLIAEVRQHGRHIASHENFEIPQEYSSPLKVGASVSPLMTASGETEGSILVLRDQSRIAELEEAMKRADRLAMLGTLAAGLAHEIKNPLGGIKGAAQLMRHELDLNSPLQEYTDVMVREVERIKVIIEQLLNLGDPQQARITNVNLGRLLDDILLLQKEAHREREVNFKLKLDPSIPPIPGDVNLLTQLFLNLIKNAAEAVDTGGNVEVTSRVTSRYQLNPGDEKPVPLIVVEVTDDGRGISQEQIDQIFTPFYTTKTAGSGLGLATCQKIVEEHLGFIQVRSKNDEGTTFAVHLPLRRTKSTTLDP